MNKQENPGFIKAFFPITNEVAGCKGESMWIKVDEVSDEVVKGTVDNHPVFSEDHGYKYGDRVVATVHSKSLHASWQVLPLNQ